MIQVYYVSVYTNTDDVSRFIDSIQSRNKKISIIVEVIIINEFEFFCFNLEV